VKVDSKVKLAGKIQAQQGFDSMTQQEIDLAIQEIVTAAAPVCSDSPSGMTLKLVR